jgi:hypothetical protein
MRSSISGEQEDNARFWVRLKFKQMPRPPLEFRVQRILENSNGLRRERERDRLGLKLWYG